MKILQIMSGKDPNGAVRYVVLLTHLLAARGHEIVVVQRPGTDLGPMNWPDGVEVVESTLQRNATELRRIAAICRDRSIDVMHTHMSRANAFGALMRIFFRVPCVATAHKLNVQLHWPFNDRVLCHNDESMRFERRWNLVAKRKLCKVPPFVDDREMEIPAEPIETTRARFDIAPNRLTFITFGNFIPRKGLIDIVEALPAIVQAGHNPLALFCGWGGEGDYRKLIEARGEALGVRDHFRFVERVSDTDRVHLMRAANLYVQASHVETGPLVVLEAMAQGLPVVGSNCGSMEDFVAQSTTGELVPVAAPNEMAAAILRVVQDGARRRAMGEAGRRRYEAEFSAAVNIPRIEAALHAAIQECRGHR